MEKPGLSREPAQADAVAGFVESLRVEVGRVLVGQQELLDSLLIGLITGGHVLVEGLPGLAKTLAAKTLARAVGVSFCRLQFTPDLLPADLLGTSIYNPEYHSFSVKQGPIFANIILADEINRAPAKVQSALLEAMQEQQVTIAGSSLRLPQPFFVMATQNPIEQEGTYPLPEAQVDRFMLKTRVTYPSRDQERQIIWRMAHPEPDLKVACRVSPEQIMQARQAVDQVYLDRKVEDYILDLVLATRTPVVPARLSARQQPVKLGPLNEWIEFGASPRASLALTLSARARALLDGRAYVVPQDVKRMAPEVLRHRIIPTYEAEAEGLTSDQIITYLLDQLRVP